MRRTLLSTGLLGLLGLLGCGAAPSGEPHTLLETLGLDATCEGATLDDTGRYGVLLTSAALDPRDRDRLDDVYWVDLERGRLVLVSLGLDDASADGPCLEPTLSHDGRTVAFVSFASNLVASAGELDGMADVFVARVPDDGEARLVQASKPWRDPDGTGSSGHSFGPSLDRTGGRVAFWTFADNVVPGDENGDVADIAVVDLDASGGVTHPIRGRLLVSRDPLEPEAAGPAGGASRWPTLSADGASLAFTSRAWNLVREDWNENLPDVFVASLEGRDEGLRGTGLRRVAVPGERVQQAAWLGSGRAQLSRDGSRVAFEVRSLRTHPEDGSVEVAELGADEPEVMGLAPELLALADAPRQPWLSADGTSLVFQARTASGSRGVFLATIQPDQEPRLAAVPLTPPGWTAGEGRGGGCFLTFTGTRPGVPGSRVFRQGMRDR